ncbi:MAG: hypothetical protein J1F39_01840 [Clostridiales bacterium]|nr:hypothetical protein [Clostridiales bacterium]
MGRTVEKHDSDIDIVNAILNVLYNGRREELAERLLKRFGSFHGIFRASREDLLKVKGMTETSAAFFSAAVPEFRRALRGAIKDIKPTSEFDLVYLAIALDSETAEKHRLFIYTDTNDKIIKCEKVTTESVKKTVGTACGINAAKIAIVEYGRRERKSPPGLPALKYITEIVKPLNAVGIEFIDYIDYIGHKFSSLRRVFGGETGYKEIKDASKEKYEKQADLLEKTEKLVSERETERK